MTNELEYQLTQDPSPFGFFQAVRLLERSLGEGREVGRFIDPLEECVRFAVNPSIAFPPSEIDSVEFPTERSVRMLVNFMGLTGPQGVLPYQYSLLVTERLRAHDPTLRDFLDIFHHRIISLFYRAWERNRLAVAFERDRQDRLTRHVADLIGTDALPGAAERFGPRSLLFYAGLLLPEQRSALALKQMLEDFFGVTVEIEQFVGGWYPLTLDTQCVVTDDEAVAGRLGSTAVVGDAVWDQQAKARIRIGPLPRTRYEEFLPGGTAHAELRALTRFFAGDGFEFELQPVLQRDQVPDCLLGVDRGEGLQLGWCTWIRTTSFDHDADDAILTV